MSQSIPSLCRTCKHSSVVVFQPPQQHGIVGVQQPVEGLHCKPMASILPMPVVECEMFEQGTPVEQRTLTALKDAGEPVKPVPKIVRARN